MITQLQLNKATTKVGKPVKAKLRLKAIGEEGVIEATVRWDASILRFIGWKVISAQGVGLMTNESNVAGGVIGLLLNPIPSAFEKSTAFKDIVELSFETVAKGTSPVAFHEKADKSLNYVSSVHGGVMLAAKYTDGRVVVK